MSDPSPSAQAVARTRARFDRATTAFGDPDAEERLAHDLPAGEPLSDRLVRYLRGRTAAVDRALLNALERGARQVVILGAGYDGRGLRYAAPGARFFEVDLPATQADKRERLERLGISAPQITFLAHDLTTPGLAGDLLAAGLEPDAPALAIAEGLAVYLPPETLAQILAELRTVATPGSRVALTLRPPSAEPRLGGDGPEPRRSALSAADAGPVLHAAGWRAVELSERGTRLGLVVARPQWDAGRLKSHGRVATHLLRLHGRCEREGLADHLAEHYSVDPRGMRELDVGVFRLPRPGWIVRLFGAHRTEGQVRGDVALLNELEVAGYPAERPAVPDPVSVHAGQSVLVTRDAGRGLPRSRPATFAALGTRLGELHALPIPDGTRAGGAWHHLAEGTPGDELAAARALLAAARPRFAQIGGIENLDAALGDADDGHGLPSSLTHPDAAPSNLIGAEPVLVDWAGAGVAPRGCALGWALWCAAHAGERAGAALLEAYSRQVELTDSELARLPGLMAARPLVFLAWRSAFGLLDQAELPAEVDGVQRRSAAIAGLLDTSVGG